jgi:fibrillarin-like rRNA methylase
MVDVIFSDVAQPDQVCFFCNSVQIIPSNELQPRCGTTITILEKQLKSCFEFFK